MKTNQDKMNQIKAHLASVLYQQFRDSGSTSRQLAAYLEISEPRLSNLMKGQLDKFSIDNLVAMLIVMGNDAHLSVQWQGEFPWVEKK